MRAQRSLRLVSADEVAPEQGALQPQPCHSSPPVPNEPDGEPVSALTPPVPPVVSASMSRGAQALALLGDAELVPLGIRGNRAALELLYRRHAAFAIHLAARINGTSRDAEDVVHDAFIKAFERLGELADPAAFRGWLGAIVVHAVRSRMRRERLMALLGLSSPTEVELDDLASESASPAVRAEIAQIYALLRTLPVDERIAWILRCIEGHELDKVARLTNCSLATAKRRIARAQKFLDDHFVDPQQRDVPVGASDKVRS